MVTVTSIKSGDWSATSTWVGGVVPGNGDAVIISTGHDVVFDVDQSGFANGLLSLQIDGILRFKPDIITYLKLNGNITLNGSLIIGTVENPIQRPPSSSTYRASIQIPAASANIITTTSSIIDIKTWVPTQMFTSLATSALINTNSIILTDDLGLQAGDRILIGVGNDFGTGTDVAYYTVSSYDVSTKTATLTTNLAKDRNQGDLVLIGSVPVSISRVSGTTAIINTPLEHCDCSGLYSNAVFISPSNGATIPHVEKNLRFVKCSTNAPLVQYSESCYFEDCNGKQGISAANSKSTYIRCASLYTTNFMGHSNKFNNCITQNALYSSCDGIVENCTFLNLRNIAIYSNMQKLLIKNSILHGGDTYNWDNLLIPPLTTIKNSLFKNNNGIGYMGYGRFKLINCLFEGTKEISDRYKNHPFNHMESINHNQITNNNQYWMAGGRIETIQENGVYSPSKLKFICESNDYPVFRDYPILAPANRTIKRLIALSKSTPEIVTKLQFIDPTNDPLIDSSATPLAESSEIVNNQIGVAYKSDTPKQIILRIFCQNSTGNVIIDTTRIDQSLAKRIS